MAKILVIRFSAIGDVAMTVPVISSLAAQYPQHQITVLSRPFMQPLFEQMPKNVSFLGIELSDYKGVVGMTRLYKRLKQMKFNYVADLHDVLRTQYLRFRFKLSGIPVEHIRKGRSGKRKLVRRYNKTLKQQKSSFERYIDVFSRLGLPVQPDFTSIYQNRERDFDLIEPITGIKENGIKWIGIAPFAKHKGKVYPMNLQEQVIAYFAGKSQYKIFLFGGGKKEQEVFDQWIEKYPGIVSLAGKMNLNKELLLMSYLDVMLSMDSANMHFASMVNTPVVSVWGATHPYAGFMGWGQSSRNAIQTNLNCRPCSVFGQKPCWRKDYVCLYSIAPSDIISKIKEVINMQTLDCTI
ncbi:glycosyltransferase family 9 protein [Bacteroides sp. 224]|uniref:glycosyltransferase family 9 protein n=1 Tax=Bacteroides sp. 224 TaxID=2302936 RepID=UPI0013D11202|nr:glycosyltransferase family 9 protein [Bacteroides sp. 224]NDV64296.1 lipopolysaccharide heptosyltransferase family protein [Bacteroides sp. 224]